jgi:FtsP/CotA-like multicopper oxidase with cupredoxin domain
MFLSRRKFIGAAGLGIVAPRFSCAEDVAEGFQTLRAQKVSMQLLQSPASKTETWQFSDDGKVSIVHATQGEEFGVRVINELDREIWFHWFGVRGPSDLMTLNIQPGVDNAVDCIFTPPDAGTFWFGPLTDASRLRDMGLYGMLVVEEKIPEPALFDLPMIIDDWKLGDDGKIDDSFGSLEAAVGAGRLGNWFTVNGMYRPHLKLPADKPCRLRILNAANVRSMNLQFKGTDPLIVALDGQPVSPRHSGDQGLVLAPGQRVDLVIDTGNESFSVALDLFEDIVEICYVEREGTAGASVLADNFALKANAISTSLDMEKAKVIPVVIAGGAKGGLKSAKLKGQNLDMRALLEQGMAWAINDAAGPGSDPIGKFSKGDTVVFEIDNRTNFEQALHIHGHVWQLIEEDGRATEGQPWRDTTIVAAMKKQKLAFIADNVGLWVLQSLVAERVDAGLLASFSVEDVVTPTP